MNKQVPQEDREILRRLAGQLASLAALPVQQERCQGWARVNDLQRGVKPMVMIREEPWNEFDEHDDLRLRCKDSFLQQVELHMRRLLFKWNHFQGDMVINPYWPMQKLTTFDSTCSVKIEEDTIAYDPKGGIKSHHYHTLFNQPEDLERIRMVKIEYDETTTLRRFQLLHDCFGDILPIRLQGLGFLSFAVWDRIAMWYNPTELLQDLILKPEWMHAIVSRYTDAMLKQLEQLDELHLLRVCNEDAIGSGGLGYVSDLPGKNFQSESVHPHNQWGNSMPQIFSDVSPDMHEEFALQYERRWMERFGLNYYGCCEPLHLKVDILKTVPNLRKVSCSPRANLERMAAEIQGRWVISVKPNPAAVAGDGFSEPSIREGFRRQLEILGDLPSEFIFKDISTCRQDPGRITRWVQALQDCL
ncbi:MAG: hypothetical protein WCT05_10680 [Lentisphaeria bacterium]